MSQRLSRKEIKRDEFREAVGRTVDYATHHTRTLALIALGVVAAAGIAVGVFLYLGSRESQAAELLNRAILVYDAPVDAESPDPDDPDAPVFADESSQHARARELLSEVRGRYGGTAAGDIARVYLGRLDLAAGDAEAARAQWREFLDRAPDHLLAAEVRLNLLRLDLEQGDPEGVAARLEAMLGETDKALPEDVILYQLASVRERLGRTDEALSAYQRILDEFPGSPYSSLAQQKTRELTAGQPS